MKALKINTRCWNCGKENNRAVSSDNDDITTPENGNLNMCINCGAIAIFDDSYPDGARKPTPSENFELSRDQHIQRILKVWRSTRGR